MIKRFISSLAALVLITGVFSGMPVYARDGSGELQQHPSDTTSTTKSCEPLSEPANSTEIQNQACELTEQFKAQARTSIDEKKTQVKAKTEEQRQKSCEARKTSLTNRMANAVTQANKHKEVFDKIYTKVQDFYTTKKLSVADYDTLKANVDKAQSDAAASIAALKSLDVSVDCTSPNVATTVSTFQQAVKSTRDSLKAYRSSITDLIKALKGASTSTDSTTDNNKANQ